MCTALLNTYNSILEAVYMEFHYACHEKISLRCPLEALIAFTCADRNEISRRFFFMSVILTAVRFHIAGKINM